eukprot:tig00021428_g21147.t1
MTQALVLVVGFVFTTAVACWLCYYLAAPTVKRDWHALVTSMICYSSSFFIILLFPSDLATSYTRNTDVGRGVYEGIWRFAYWSTQILSNVVVPMQQSWVQAGEFTRRGKLRRFGKENLWKLSAVLVIAVIALVVLVAKFRSLLNMTSLLALLIGLGNAYGLVFCVLLLGFGSVEMPRRVWQAGDAAVVERRCQARARAAYDRLDDAACLVALYRSRAQEAGRVLEGQRGGEELRPHVERILAKVPEGYDPEEQARLLGRDAEAGVRAGWAGEAVTLSALVDLHRDLKDAALRFQRARSEWEALVAAAREARDVLENARGAPAPFRSSDPARPQRPPALLLAEWWWKCRVRGPALRGAALVLGAASVAVVWSEVTLFAGRPLSPFAYLVSPGASFGAVQLRVALPLAYMAACAYFTLSTLRIPYMYQLGAGRRTDAYSLLFHAAYAARISSSMCYNYMHMLSLDPALPLTAFERIMGPALSFFGSLSRFFNLYFPICVGVFCGVAALPRRALEALRLAFLRPGLSPDPDALADGAALLDQGPPPPRPPARLLPPPTPPRRARAGAGKGPGRGGGRGGALGGTPSSALEREASAMAMLPADDEDRLFAPPLAPRRPSRRPSHA